jgi:hypothetical protein
MQPVNTRTIQNQILPQVQKKAAEHKQAPDFSTSKSRNTAALPEDIVNLSSVSQKSTQNTSQSRTPSTPVSQPEKESLLKTSDGKMTFSTYA